MSNCNTRIPFDLPATKRTIVLDGKEYELVEVKKREEPETFEECCKKFPHSYWLDDLGDINMTNEFTNYRAILNGAASPSQERELQISAIRKLMIVADALNPAGWTHLDRTVRYGMVWNKGLGEIQPSTYISALSCAVHFPTEELAKKAIKILGEDVIKTALGV